MIRSLRWRLQLWHAAVLTIVLIIFGGVVYALQWQTRLQQMDAELDRVAQVLTSRLRGLFPVPRNPNGPGGRPPRQPGRGGAPRPGEEPQQDAQGSATPAVASTATSAESSATDKDGPQPRSQRGNQPLPRPDDEKIDGNVVSALAPEGANASNSPVTGVIADSSRDDLKVDPTEPRRREGRGNQRGNSRDGSRDGQREGGRDQSRDGREGPREPGRDGPRDQQGPPRFDPPPGLGLPEEFKNHFLGDDENSFYYVIWDQKGVVLANSKPVDDITFPNLQTGSDHLPVRTVRTRLQQREVVHGVHVFWRGDINVLVGRSLVPHLTALHRTRLLLGLTGLSVLAIGLAGGWGFSSRAIRPIAQMTATAESISVKNLSKRINVESTATELEQLAVVLNHTFDRLQSAFERQAQFTADASHELRTPLAVILSHAELALARTRSPDEYQAAFNTCRRAAMRMKSLIDSLLLLARFDSVAPELERQQFDVERMAQEAVEMLQTLAAERQVKLTCKGEPVSINGDRERLFQVITNLLSNAIRYNRPGGDVELEVTTNAQSAILRVRDTGVGISAEHLPRIFDRFYRVDKARSHAEGGCGLGLAICQTIVDAHLGTITATSELGVGTTIEVRLPIVKDEKSPGAKSGIARYQLSLVDEAATSR